MKRVLLGIDLQYDFCNAEGSLYVKGADEDSRRISNFIRNKAYDLDAIILSMDSHQPIHIAHQVYWYGANGFPELYSTVTKEDVLSKKWNPQYNQELALDYLERLEAKGETCTIWPPHCIIGTKGWSIEEEIFRAIEEWSINFSGKPYELINKGMYQATEHYSIFKAAVEYPNIPETLFNKKLVERLDIFDQIIIVGEAADFCVANSLKDLLEEYPSIGAKTYILTDCMSYIIPENKKAKDIFKHAQALGATFCKSTDLQF